MPRATQQDEHIGRTIVAIFICSAITVAWLLRGILGFGAGAFFWILGLAFGLGRFAVFAALVAAIFWIVRDRIDAYVEHHHTRLDVERLVQGGADAPIAGELTRAQDLRDPVKAA